MRHYHISARDVRVNVKFMISNVKNLQAVCYCHRKVSFPSSSLIWDVLCNYPNKVGDFLPGFIQNQTPGADSGMKQHSPAATGP